MSFGFSDGDDTIIKGDDGSVEGQKIGAEGDRLKVDSSISSANKFPCVDNKYRIEWSETLQSLPNANNPALEVYSYSGSGKLFGLTARFNSDRVDLSLVIDSVTVFNLNLDAIEAANPSGNDALAIPFADFEYTNGKNLITIKPPFPICFSSSVSIQARADSNNNNRELLSYWVSLLKES